MSYWRPASKNNLTFSFSERSVTSIYIELVQACMHPNIIGSACTWLATVRIKMTYVSLSQKIFRPLDHIRNFLFTILIFFVSEKKLICASLLWQSTKILMVLGLAECLQPASFFFFFLSRVNLVGRKI